MMTQQNYWKAAQPYVAAFGSESEQERYEAAVLPVKTLDAIVDRGLWDSMSGGGFHVRKRLTHAEVEEIAVKRGKAQAGTTVAFEKVENIDEMRENWWETLQRIRQWMPEGTQVTTFMIVAHCGELSLQKPYARLVQNVGGKEFKLELCLD